MTTAAVQTIWADLVVASLVDGGVRVVVISPGSRSTPLVAALAKRAADLELVTIIDERAAAFYALGVARATNLPAALVCTSGTAAAHYLPAMIEASLAGVPLLAITSDRPPELQHCGASQTIEQHGLYRAFVRSEVDLGTPVASEAGLRAVHRTMKQSITHARGPHPGPVHVNVPLRKPLEPAAPATEIEAALARFAASLAGGATAPRVAADTVQLELLAHAIAAEPDGVIVAGAMPAQFAAARDELFALAVRAGYPIIAEAGSQLRLCPRDGAVHVDHFDLAPADAWPAAKLVIQLGAEPVAAGWSAWLAHAKPARYVLAGHAWHDPEGTARSVILGDVGDAIARLVEILERTPFESRSAARWAEVEARVADAAATAIAQHPRSETALVREAVAAVPAGGLVQVGNSLPIRVIDHACAGGDLRVITQRGAAGIDGLIASAAGATRAGRPVLLVLGDVSFVHDLGGLVCARDASAAPLAIVVVDNRGGQIFAGLPVARAELGAAFAEHWLTPPGIDPAAVASALGLRAVTAATPEAAATAVGDALAQPGVTVIHAPVSMSGAHDVRRTAIELLLTTAQRRTS